MLPIRYALGFLLLSTAAVLSCFQPSARPARVVVMDPLVVAVRQ